VVEAVYAASSFLSKSLDASELGTSEVEEYPAVLK